MQLSVAATVLYVTISELFPLQGTEIIPSVWLPNSAGFRAWLTTVALERTRIGQPFNAVSLQGGSQSERSRSADGVKYLTSQLGRVDSAFHMPSEQAEQQLWEDWFLKLAEVPTYYEMSSEQIIYAVTGHMKYNDRVLYGWPDTVNTLRSLSQPITLDAFFTHIRFTLFACRETRKSALEELMSLPRVLSTVADCSALIVRLRQIWSRLYPTTTSEREPMTRQSACIHIHKMLIEASKCSFKQRQSSMLLTAWSNHLFPASQLYRQFLHDDLHASAVDAVKSSELYLAAVFKELDSAHQMHVNVVRTNDTSSTHAAFAIQPTKGKQVSGKSGKRGRSASREPTRDRGNSRGSSAAAPTKSKPSSATFIGLTDSGEKRERANPIGCRFTDVATAAGFDLTMDLCCKRGRDSQCFLCCEPGGHTGGPTACPKVPHNRRDAVAQVVAARAAHRRAVQKEYPAGNKARKVAAAK
jgi:hypothetical protein